MNYQTVIPDLNVPFVTILTHRLFTLQVTAVNID